MAPPITPMAGAMMARGALPNLLNCPVCLAACCSRWVTPGMKAVRRTADVPTRLKKVSGPELTMLLVNS